MASSDGRIYRQEDWYGRTLGSERFSFDGLRLDESDFSNARLAGLAWRGVQIDSQLAIQIAGSLGAVVQ